MIAEGATSLCLPLGSWYANLCHCFHRFNLLDTHWNILYQRQKEGWERWNQRQGHCVNQLSGNALTFTRSHSRLVIPHDGCVLVTTHDKYWHATVDAPQAVQAVLRPPRTLSSFILSMKSHHAWSLQFLDSLDDAMFIASAI